MVSQDNPRLDAGQCFGPRERRVITSWPEPQFPFNFKQPGKDTTPRSRGAMRPCMNPSPYPIARSTLPGPKHPAPYIRDDRETPL
jgi:hypothetical protein